MKTAFIIHGFNGDTTYTFGPWLKEILESKGFKVLMPKFPIRAEASFCKWSQILDTYKEFFVKIIPICIAVVAFCFVGWAPISSFGMVMFWGILLIAIYNILVTNALLKIKVGK